MNVDRTAERPTAVRAASGQAMQSKKGKEEHAVSKGNGGRSKHGVSSCLINGSAARYASASPSPLHRRAEDGKVRPKPAVGQLLVNFVAAISGKLATLRAPTTVSSKIPATSTASTCSKLSLQLGCNASNSAEEPAPQCNEEPTAGEDNSKCVSLRTIVFLIRVTPNCACLHVTSSRNRACARARNLVITCMTIARFY